MSTPVKRGLFVMGLFHWSVSSRKACPHQLHHPAVCLARQSLWTGCSEHFRLIALLVCWSTGSTLALEPPGKEEV